MGTIRAHLICETHWDREWYLTREEFGVKLVRLVDSLLDTIEGDEDYVCFMLDGQTIALEDYLRIRPRNRERLKKAIGSGKIAIGPWYILSDELLVSGESHIRNYLAGERIVSQFGAKNNIGYLPDSFGHPEQMPQILAGLGLDTIVFWRGTSDSIEKSEFLWSSPCEGVRVLAVHMPNGYGNAACLSPDMAETVPRLNSMIDGLRRRSTTDAVLLMNGSDHVLPQGGIVEILAEVNKALPGDRRILFSTLAAYLKDLVESRPSLATYSGELRSGDRDMVLGGTLSTRVYLKQRNMLVQRRMERFLEPLASAEVLAAGAGLPGGGFLDYQNLLWNKILENQPHDSICGCSVDAVHEEMITRYNCIDQLQESVQGELLARLERSLRPCGARSDAQCLYFEATQDRLPSYQEVEVDFDAMLVNRVNFAKSIIEDFEPGIEHPPLPAGVSARDQYGREISCELVSAHKAYHMDLQDHTLPEVYKVNRCRVGILLPGFDFGLHVIRFSRAGAAAAPPMPGPSRIANEYYAVEYDASDASFTIEDLRSGLRHKGVGRIRDLADAGDEYTYSWIDGDRPIGLDPGRVSCQASRRAGLYEELSIEGGLLLPEGLAGDRKSRSLELRDCPLRLSVRLYAGVRRVDLRLDIENNAKDHRLQVEVPAGLLVHRSSSSTAFAVTERDVELEVPQAWMEYPQNAHPTHGFVHAGSDERGVSVCSDSTNEFECANEGGQTLVLLTLLRCVGWLSRPDLFTRKGNGGWNLPSPGAQCPGPHSFDFSVIYHEGGFLAAGTLAQADRRQHVFPLFQLRKSAAQVEVPAKPLAFVSELPQDVRFSALKFAEDGSGLVLRMFSVGRVARKFSMDLPPAVRKVKAVDLAERHIKAVELRGTSFEVEIRPAEILSFEFLFG